MPVAFLVSDLHAGWSSAACAASPAADRWEKERADSGRTTCYTHTGSNTAREVPWCDLQVWDFMADFSNMKLLNPLLTDFQVLSESTDPRRKGRGREAWSYTVRY